MQKVVGSNPISRLPPKPAPERVSLFRQHCEPRSGRSVFRLDCRNADLRRAVRDFEQAGPPQPASLGTTTRTAQIAPYDDPDGEVREAARAKVMTGRGGA